MKYRAIAIGVTKDGHPIQGFFAAHNLAMDWANTIAIANKCSVQVYKIVEEPLPLVVPPEEPK